MIREIKLEETEEGYRVEIKGDKERLKKFFEQWPFGMPFGFDFTREHGPKHRPGPHHFKFKARRRHGPHRHRGWGPPRGGRAWWVNFDDDDENSYSV